MLGIGLIKETRLQFPSSLIFKGTFSLFFLFIYLNGACYDALPFILVGKKKIKFIKVEALGA